MADQSGELVDCSRQKVRRGVKRVTGENSLDKVHMHGDGFLEDDRLMSLVWSENRASQRDIYTEILRLFRPDCFES